MSLEQAARAAAPLTPAVASERYWELAHADDPRVAAQARTGIARNALLARDWTLADPLLDLDDDHAAVEAAAVARLLGATTALPRLAARLDTCSEDAAAELLTTLEILGDAGARERLRAARPDVSAALEEAATAGAQRVVLAAGPVDDVLTQALTEGATSYEDLCDRAGGELRALALLSRIAGEDVLPAAAVEAIRRRDGAAVAAALRALVDVDPSRAALPFSVEAPIRRTVALACADALASRAPKKDDFDALAVAALAHAVVVRAAVSGGLRAALAVAFLEGRSVLELCRVPEADPTPLLRELAEAEVARAQAAMVEPAIAWRAGALAPALVYVASMRSPSWMAARGLGAPLLERELVEAFRAADLAQGEEISHGELVLLAQLASREAYGLALALVRSGSLLVRSALPILAGAFPADELVTEARRQPPLNLDDLRDRFSLLAALAPGAAPPDGDVAVHCRACGHVWSGEGATFADLGMVSVPFPPAPCPSCARAGSARGFGSIEGALRWPLPAVGWLETPRDALDRLERDPEASPLDVAELLELCGETDRADAQLQLVPPEALHANLPRALRLFLRRERWADVRRLALRALEGDDALPIVLDDEAVEIREALATACAQLGEPVPELPRAARPRPTPRAAVPATAAPKPGRNDPCPCGSGRKFKKCHGA